MYNLIKKLCARCKSYFHNSESSCISFINIQDKISLLIKPSTTIEVKIIRKIESFCRITKNNFWILYYNISQSKIYFSCSKCNKNDLCQEYILSRIIKHIKAFDTKQESKVFQKVRAGLTKKINKITVDKRSQEVVIYYIKKINKDYNQKAFNFESAFALIESSLVEQESQIQVLVKKRLQRYKIYKSPIILRDIVYEALESDKELKEPILIELLHKEKFTNYIKRVIESRFIDFTRTPKYKNEITKDIDDNGNDHTNEDRDHTSQDINTILKPLSNEEKIIYKLKYAIPLNNREFLYTTYKMNYLKNTLIYEFTPSEKLYIKFSIQYEIEDDSRHFSMIDVEKVKESISKKISKHRETIESHSYIKGNEEIYIKLIYSEALSAKEMAKIFNLNSKQINKKVENIKKKLLS